MFHDFTVTPSGERGQLVSLTNRGGNSATVQSVNAAGLPTDIQAENGSAQVSAIKSLSEKRLWRGGQAPIAPPTPQNEPVRGGSR